MTIILLFAMSSKVAFGIYRLCIEDLNKFFTESELHDDWRSPLYWIIGFSLSEFLPVTALLLSFWYGLTRRNKVIRSRKYSNPQSSTSDKSSSFWDERSSMDDDFYTENPFGIGKQTKITVLNTQPRSTEDYMKKVYENRFT